MNFKCNQCGAELHPLDNFCSTCGAEAPRKTVFVEVKKAKIVNPIYCHVCKTKNNKNALYCSECGEQIYKKTQAKQIYCPNCGEKNSSDAKLCFNCSLSFNDWFSMRGDVAKNLGLKGELRITEKMTGVSYYFINQPKMSMGRNADNDIVIPCNWISGKHCVMDLESKKLIDVGSTNGTFINRKPDRIKTVSLHLVSEFNIAGSFTFKITKGDNFFAFRLGAILDEDECRRNGDGNAFDKLRKIYFISVNGDCEIQMRKLDGHIDTELKPNQDYYKIKIKNGFYYYSDESRGISEQLVFKDIFNLPKNWERCEFST